MDFLTNPFIVAMMFLYQLFAGNLVIAIIAFTIIVRLVTYPLTAAQYKSSRKMQELAPKLKQIREKYKNDREKQAQAQMALYRENNVNPLGGCLPLLVQFPVLIGLYGAIYSSLAATPLQMLDVQHRLMVPDLARLLPLQNQFLWLNLGQPDPIFLMPILVVATTWLQTKLTMPPTTDPKDPSAAMTRNMTTIMPLMIGLISLSFASGLSLYWIISNVAGIAQYALMGRVNWGSLFGRAPAPASTGFISTTAIDPAPEPVKPKRKVESLPEKSERGDKEKVDMPALKKKSLSETGYTAGGYKNVKPPTSANNLNRKKKPGAPVTRKTPDKG